MILWSVVTGCRPQPEHRPEPATAVAPHAAPARSDGRVPEAQVLEDLHLVLGGNFSIDHVGPEVYRATVERYHADPAAYLDGVVALEDEHDFARGAYPALPRFLGELYPLEPQRTRVVAGRMAKAHRSAASKSDLDAGRRERLRESAEALDVLAGGVDVPFEAGWAPLRFDRVCTAAIPGPPFDGRIGLRIVDDCTCGESRACAATVRGDHIEIEAKVGPLGRCRDCFSSWTTCTLPRLAPNATYSVRAQERTLGRLRTTDTGWPGNVCIEAWGR